MKSARWRNASTNYCPFRFWFRWKTHVRHIKWCTKLCNSIILRIHRTRDLNAKSWWLYSEDREFSFFAHFKSINSTATAFILISWWQHHHHHRVVKTSELYLFTELWFFMRMNKNNGLLFSALFFLSSFLLKNSIRQFNCMVVSIISYFCCYPSIRVIRRKKNCLSLWFSKNVEQLTSILFLITLQSFDNYTIFRLLFSDGKVHWINNINFIGIFWTNELDKIALTKLWKRNHYFEQFAWFKTVYKRQISFFPNCRGQK